MRKGKPIAGVAADLILGSDAGGTPVKAAIYSLDGTCVGSSERHTAPNAPRVGLTEHDVERTWADASTVAIAASVGVGLFSSDDEARRAMTKIGRFLEPDTARHASYAEILDRYVGIRVRALAGSALEGASK